MGEQPSHPLRLSVRGVSKSYGAVHALKETNLELRPGEVMALLGENGAGKSTIVKVLSGLVDPDTGVIEVDGVPVDLGSTARSREAGIAVVQQEFSSVATMSVAENFVLGSSDQPVWRRRRLAELARPHLAAVGLRDLDPDRLVEDLSVAELQLLEIARVLARNARIVIFDEPTAALSDAEIERVLGVVRDLAARGISVIYVTHRLPEVFRIADRITIFRNGRSQEPVDVAATSVDGVITQMLGRRLEEMYPTRPTGFGTPRLEITRLRVPGLRQPISFSLRQGEILGLAGQIGSGVDLLMRALSGVLPTFDGTVSLDEAPVDLRSRRAGIRAGIAYCSSDRKYDGIYADLSATENLSSAWLSRITRAGVLSRRRENQLAQGIAQQFAIDPSRLRMNVGRLSGGNQQKIAFGKWIGIGAKVLLVEEPTRGVDVGARAEIYASLRTLCQEGMSVVVSSSDTAEIYGLADTIATFYHGQLTAMKTHEQWTESELVRRVMQEEVVA